MIFSISSYALASSNPFVGAWCDADAIGKAIFIGLIALSIISWTLIGYKFWVLHTVKELSAQFKRSFYEQKESALAVKYASKARPETPNGFYMIYDALRSKALELLTKKKENSLCPADISLLESHAFSMIQSITKLLEKNIYMLSTTVTLAPFLGLLGTVYGILITFSSFSSESASISNQHILGGLSLALTTTVLGLINAIPALIGYSTIKNNILEFENDMERFSTEVLSSIDIQYRR